MHYASCGRRISLFTLRNYFQMPRYMPVNSKDEQSTGSVYRKELISYLMRKNEEIRGKRLGQL